MSQRGLEALLRPKSIAVIGASMKPNRAGYLMMRNLLAGGFNGPVLPVTPTESRVGRTGLAHYRQPAFFSRSCRFVYQCQPQPDAAGGARRERLQNLYYFVSAHGAAR